MLRARGPEHREKTQHCAKNDVLFLLTDISKEEKEEKKVPFTRG
jgi:hypothetical protein